MKYPVFLLCAAVLLAVSGCPAVMIWVPEPVGGAVALSGTAEFGHTLTANTFAIVGGDRFTYQWLRVELKGRTETEISGADGSSYTVTAADIGSRISVRVGVEGKGGSLVGGPTPPVGRPILPYVTGDAVIDGTTTLSVRTTVEPYKNPDRPNNVSSLHYTWRSEGVTLGIGETYTRQASDYGKMLTVAVSNGENPGAVIASTHRPIPAQKPDLGITPPSNNAADRFKALISQNDYELLFPNRFAAGGIDFYSYQNLIDAITYMSTIQLAIHYKVDLQDRVLSWLYQVRRKIGSESEEIIVSHKDYEVSNLSGLIVPVNYNSFLNSNDPAQNKRELAAFLAHFAHETSTETDGWGNREDYGFYWNEEPGWNGNSKGGYATHPSDINSSNWPPRSGRSYHPRGPARLAWNYNYGFFSAVYFGDERILLDNPELLTQNGVLAFASAIWLWMTPQRPLPLAREMLNLYWVENLINNQQSGLGKGNMAEWQAAGWKERSFGTSTMAFTGGFAANLPETDSRIATRVAVFKKALTVMSASPLGGEQLYTQGMRSLADQPAAGK